MMSITINIMKCNDTFWNPVQFQAQWHSYSKNCFVKGKLKVCKNPSFLLPLIFSTEYLQQFSIKNLKLRNYPMLVAFLKL